MVITRLNVSRLRRNESEIKRILRNVPWAMDNRSYRRKCVLHENSGETRERGCDIYIIDERAPKTECVPYKVAI